MVFSDNPKFCFISVPKTGTSSVSAALLQKKGTIRNTIVLDGKSFHFGEHDSVEIIIRAIGRSNWDSLFSFAFVRNPWSRVVSAYHFYQNGRVAAKVEKKLQKGFRASMAVFVARYVPFWLWVILYRPRPYADYLVDSSGEIAVNEFYKFENLAEGYECIMKRLGDEGVNLGFKNKSEHGDYREYYNFITKRIVALRFQGDLKTFGYSFDE